MKVSVTIFLVFISLVIYPQIDGRWVCGSPPTIMEFQQDTTVNYPLDSNLYTYIIETCASICDEADEILFFSNGMCLFNSKGDTIENAFGFHPPKLSTFYDVAATSTQAALIIPRTNNTFYYFYYSMTDSAFNHNLPFNLLYYSIVDMNLNNGKGKVVSKNNILLKDSFLNAYGLTACRHANGRDWWLIKADYLRHGYYEFLVTVDSIQGPFYQAVENINHGTPAAFGQSCFSKQGNLFASINFSGGIKVMDFDRCTGELSLKYTLTLPYDAATQLGIGGNGLSFSPSGRFIYANTFKKVFQFDLANTNIQQSIIQIGQEDSSSNSMLVTQQVGRDNKIYIANYNGFPNKLSVIQNPENIGVSSDFRYHGVTLKGSMAATAIPNMINYSLGALVGSVCDTITTIKELPTNGNKRVFIYPNPTRNTANLFLNLDEQETGALVLHDLLGNTVLTYSLVANKTFQTISLDDVNSGTYFYRIQTTNGFKSTGKVVVIK